MPVGGLEGFSDGENLPNQYQPSVHDWRPGDRIASIAVKEPTAKTGLGTVQRVILDKAIVVWDDGKQSQERLQDLIYGGNDSSKIVLDAESVEQQIRDELKSTSERVAVNRTLIAGFPIDTIGNLVRWR